MTVEFFGAVVPPEETEKWKSKAGQKQTIGQAKLLPVLVARLTWADVLRRRQVLYFIDNESVRLALIKSYRPMLASLKLVMACLHWDFENASVPWYARVASPSNIGDGPSRLDPSLVKSELAGVAVRPVFPDGVKMGWYLE